MNKTLLPIRLVFVLLCAAAGWLLCSTIPDWDDRWMTAISVDLLIGILVVLVDILLKGFSLRGLSAITFGLIVGSAARTSSTLSFPMSASCPMRWTFPLWSSTRAR